MTAHIRQYTKSVYFAVRNYRIPWEVSTAGVSLVSYAWIMALVVVMLASSACAAVNVPEAASPYVAQSGYIEPVRWTAVYDGLRQALMGNTRSLLMYSEKSRVVLAAWPRAGGWAWVALDTSYKNVGNALHAIGGQGNLMACSDFSCLIKGAESIGYRQVTPTDLLRLAPEFCASVLQQTVAFAANALTSIVIIPVTPAMMDMPGAPVESVQ